MKCVFEASTGLDAHMILNLLEQHGITGRIEGEYLQGGIGELAAMGFVRVLVAEDASVEATRIISEWESIQPPDEKAKPEIDTSNASRTFIAGLFVGALLMYWLLRVFTN